MLVLASWRDPAHKLASTHSLTLSANARPVIPASHSKNPSKSSRTERVSWSTYLTTRLSCSLLDTSVTSSVITVNHFAAWTLVMIFCCTWSATTLITWFWITGDVYVAFLEALARCSSRMVSPASTLKSSKALKFPGFSTSSMSFSKSVALSQCPRNGMFCRPQNTTVLKMEDSFWWLQAMLSVRAWLSRDLMSGC